MSLKGKISQVAFLFIFVILRAIYYIVRPLFAMIYEKQKVRLPITDNELLLKPANELEILLRNKEIKSVDLVNAVIQRIKRVNPTLNAVVAQRFQLAIEEATKADEILNNNDKNDDFSIDKKPLFGIPMTIKECFAVEGMPWTSGLLSRKGVIADFDAVVVKKLKDAGAIIIGVTNVSELCMWWETNNLVYGKTNNAYHAGRIVGGSSGGEGCIISAASTTIGLGSDIGGSIRMPAFFNGIYGLKPTPFVVDNSGQYPEATKGAKSFLSTGPMCRYASDLLPLLKVMCGAEKCLELRLDTPVDVRNVRIFYMMDDGGGLSTLPVHENINSAINRVVEHFKLNSFEVYTVDLPEFKNCVNLWFAKMDASGEQPFSEQLANGNKNWNLFYEFIRLFLRKPRHTLPGLMLGLLERFPMPEKVRKALIKKCDKLRSDLISLLGNNGVLIFPGHPTPALYHHEPVLVPFNWSYTGVFNVLQVPVCAVPLGISSSTQTPIGCQIIASPKQDRLCIAIANYLEKQSIAGWTMPFE